MPRTVVTLSYVAAQQHPPHAGGVYLREWCEALHLMADVTLLCPSTRVNEQIAADDAPPQGRLLLVPRRGRALPIRVLNRLSLALDRLWRRIDVGLPWLPWVVGIVTSAEARHALREADVIDLQWADAIRLAPLVRLLNRRAILLGTFHDVQSQLFARERTETPKGRRFWAAQARRAARAERRAVTRLDQVITFSRKDLDLLGSPSHGVVIDPPLAVGAPVVHQTPARPTVVFVSYLARDENDDAARWLLDQIWPRVRADVPAARLLLVGGGASDSLVARAEQVDGVELTGFVDDLDAVHAAATTAIIPLRQGAGVKFKVIDALLAGVPTITTPVGAEGIGDDDGDPQRALWAGLSSDAHDLATALVRVLRDPASAASRSAQAQSWAHRTYGRDQFRSQVARLVEEPIEPA